MELLEYVIDLLLETEKQHVLSCMLLIFFQKSQQQQSTDFYELKLF